MTGLAALVLLAGCSREEILDRKEECPIAFADLYLDNLTRGGGTEVTTGMRRFLVYAILEKNGSYASVFDGTEVYLDTQAVPSRWTYSPIQYWWPGATYWFKAVNPPSGNDFTVNRPDLGSDRTVSGPDWIANTSLSFTNRGDHDLVYATHSRTADGTAQTVKLHFHHALARVRFSFQHNLADIYTVTVSDIRMDNAIASGVMTLDDQAVWTLPEGAGNLELDFGRAGIRNDRNGPVRDSIYKGETGSCAPLYLIPGNARDDSGSTSAFSVSFQVDIYRDNVLLKSLRCHALLPVTEGGLVQGNSYNYTTSLSMESLTLDRIEFSVEAEAWEKGAEGSLEAEW